MPLVCPQCHTENSEQLRVCIACGAALPLPVKPSPPPSDHGRDSDTFDALYAPTLMMGAAQGSGVDPEGQVQALPRGRAHTHLPPLRRRPKRRLRWLLAAAAASLALAAWYWYSNDASPKPGQTGQADFTLPASVAPAPASDLASAPDPVTPASGAPADAPTVPMTPVAPAPAASSAASATPATAASSPPSPRRAMPASAMQRASGPDASTLPVGSAASRHAIGSDKASAPRQSPRALATASSAARVAASGARTPEAVVSPEPALVVDVPSVVSTLPEPRPTAQQLCASRHFLLRPFCESNECSKPEHANDPYCQALKAQATRRPER